MTIDDINNILIEIFFEDVYKIQTSDFTYHGKKIKRINLKVFSEKLNNYVDIIFYIENLILGTTVFDDVFQINLTLPKQNYYLTIPGTSKDRNPKDIGDPKAFLQLLKEKVKDIQKINELNNKLFSDVQKLDKTPMKEIRNFKLDNLLND